MPHDGSERTLLQGERGPSPIAVTNTDEGKTMKLRTRIAAGATAAAMASIFGLAGTADSAAPSAPTSSIAATRAAIDLPVTGTLPDGSTFTGQLSNLSRSVVNGAPMLSGMLTGTGLPAAGLQFTTAITDAQATCKILDVNVVDLGILPQHFEFLGLVVNVDAVHLTIEAVEGPGNTIGNLVCAILRA